MNKSFGILLFLILFLCVNHSPLYAQNPYSLELKDYTWSNPNLDVLIITPENTSWWNSGYLNSSIRAIGQWKDGISAFSVNQSNYKFLSKLSFSLSTSTIMEDGYDVYIYWVEKPSNDSVGQGGLTTTWSRSRIIENATISLSVEDGRGFVMDEVDMQNVAVHEFGHALGLGHSDYYNDLMYAGYVLGSSIREVSTLDVFGVASIFGWMAEEDQIMKNDQWPKSSIITLPQGIEYSYLPISENNIPPMSPFDSFFSNLVVFFRELGSFILNPISLVTFASIAIALIVIMIVYSKKKRQKQ